MDDVDRAQKVNDMHQALALKQQKERYEASLVDQPAMQEGRECIDCEVVIPPKRVKLVNAIRCAECQSLHEQLLDRGMIDE